jgi:hypothetical protein
VVDAISLEIRRVMGQLRIRQRTWTIMEEHWQINYTEDKTEMLGGKTCFLATSSTTRFTQTALEMNPSLCDEKHATNFPTWTTLVPTDGPVHWTINMCGRIVGQHSELSLCCTTSGSQNWDRRKHFCKCLKIWSGTEGMSVNFFKNIGQAGLTYTL